MLHFKSFLWASCLSFLGGSLPAFAQSVDDFNPENPDEPTAISYCLLKVSADPAEAAYVSGGGKYIVNGNSVYVSTSACNTADYNYEFLYWTLNGVKTSYSQYFWYTPVNGKQELVAHYDKHEVVFDPNNPDEPSTSGVKRKFRLYLTSSIEGGCSFNIASGDRHEESSNIYVYASLNAGYKFDGWSLNGTIVSTSQGYSFTMPSANTTLEAMMSELPFDPENPLEPTGAGTDVDTSGRKIIDIVIGHESTVVDKTRVVFNEQKTLGYDTGSDAAKFISNTAAFQIYSLDGDGNIYSVNQRPEDDGEVSLGVIVKEAGEVAITATRLDCSVSLIDKQLNKWHDLALGSYTFSGVAGTIEDRFVLTTKQQTVILGDVNGNGGVDIGDAVTIVNYLVGKESSTFVAKAADTNRNGQIDIGDAVTIVNYLVGKTASLSQQNRTEWDELEPQ